MVEKVVGFIGCYQHDFILLLAEAMTAMGKRLLLVDRNSAHILRSSFPVPEGLSPKEHILCHHDLFFTEVELTADILKDYDFIFIDFGLHSLHFDSKLCNRFILTTDMLPHHYQSLLSLSLKKETIEGIVIRDAIWPERRSRAELTEFFLHYRDIPVCFLRKDRRDALNRYVCESQNEYLLRNASEELNELIKQFTLSFCKGVTEREYQKMLQRFERRKQI